MEYFDCWYRLDDNDRHLIWYSSDEDGVVVTPAPKKVLTFATSEDLLSYARTKGIEIKKEMPILHRLDVVVEWLTSTIDLAIPSDDFLNAWNLVGDVARSIDRKDTFVELESGAANVYDKLFWGAKPPSVTPANGTYIPQFSCDESRQMRALFSWGVGVFREHVVLVQAN